MSKNWNHNRALEHINKKLKDVESVTIKDYVRDMSLVSIPTNVAYRVDGVHLYADIQNLSDMLNITAVEGTDCHKRTLRFLDQHYRAVKRILDRVDGRRVDFHSQRLHALFTKPYNSETDAEKKRVQRAVATAQLIVDVLAETGDDDQQIPAAKVRIGIDSGLALAVNNGRNGYREPLFLGDPANHAAKLASNNTTRGIYLTNAARAAVDLKEVDAPEKSPLSKDEVKVCQDAAKLDVTAENIVEEWREDLKENPIGNFQFSRQTPPLCDMDIMALTPANSKRQDMVSLYADIDGFTAYVADNIEDNAQDVVRTLHVLRAEMERVVTSDFEGRRVRFIGDCIQALTCEGTAQNTDEEKSVSESTRLAGALRSSFNLSIDRLKEFGYESGKLGLAIGFDLGPVSVTRLGRHADRIRCAIGRKVIESENRQCACKGDETAIGQAAYDAGSEAVKKLFGTRKKVANLDYVEATEALADDGDESAKNARVAAYAGSPAIIKSDERVVEPYMTGGLEEVGLR
ncbi:adenylate/guanylate cyclase domain-containing protein [Pseudomonas rhodesiae]|uniref:Adenylate and Guanylate cyclase catalytic domain-containing protein n=1 Tax=Pseudomonas rhodesiae TaxID=76760 RepID=A0AAE8HFL8_9PSED|nr:adenylate/guanylate cyclase domain-containing protein [Pseudomonas rhodesiae]TWR54594.1 transcriptional regulator [Pseudomonas rhodesiae]SDV13872.1 Adenylate and Guanylate cyclase catalytic domain-containing protein [Pseudomonas rhodesiae]